MQYTFRLNVRPTHSRYSAPSVLQDGIEVANLSPKYHIYHT